MAELVSVVSENRLFREEGIRTRQSLKNGRWWVGRRSTRLTNNSAQWKFLLKHFLTVMADKSAVKAEIGRKLTVIWFPGVETSNRKSWLTFCLCMISGLLYLLVQCTSTSSPGETHPRHPAYLIKARHGAVASENVVCSEIGVDVLKDGGNAVDAAIASTFCIGVLDMFSYVYCLRYMKTLMRYITL